MSLANFLMSSLSSQKRRIFCQQWLVSSGLTLLASLWAGSPTLAQTLYFNRALRLAEIAFEYAEAERPEKAVSLLKQAEAQVDDSCFAGNTLLKIGVGYLNAGRLAEGEQFLTQAFETAHQRTLERCAGSGTSPEESLLNRAVEYAAAGHFELASQIVAGVDNWMTPIAMAKIAGYYSATGQQRQAEEMLTQAIAIAQNNTEAPMILLGMTSYLIQANHPELAKFVITETDLAQPQALNLSQSPEMVVHLKLGMVQILAALAQPQQALALLDQAVLEIQPLPDFPIQETSELIEAALLYNSLGQVSQANEVLARTHTLLPKLPSAGIIVQARVRLVQGYAAMGDFDQANALAASIEVDHERQRAYGAIAAEYARAGLTEAAARLAQSLGWPEFELWDMFRAYLDTEQYSQAQQLAQQIDDPNMLREMGQVYLEAGELKQALHIIDLIPPDNSVDWLRGGIAIAFAKQNQFDQALDLAQTIAEPGNKVDVLIAIAARYSDPQKAVEILDQALNILQTQTSI